MISLALQHEYHNPPIYNDHAAESAAGQFDIFSGGVKSKEDILKEVLNIINNGTETERKEALAGATERRKEAAGVQENGTAGTGYAGGGAAGEKNTLGETGNSNKVDDWYGPVYTQFEGKAVEAEAHLRETKEGVAKGVLIYPGVAPIDLVWGDMNAGYMKIVAKHPEVVGKLQDILSATTIKSQSDNRIVFESDTHKMVVSRMKGQQTTGYLLPMRKKKSPSPPAVVTLKRNPRARGMARLLLKTVLFQAAKIRTILELGKKKLQVLKIQQDTRGRSGRMCR